jgi:CRISPR-associated protein Csx16
MDGASGGDCVANGRLAALDWLARRRYYANMVQNDNMQKQGITWFVSRHTGAIEWARRQGLAVDRWVTHLAAGDVTAGDTVIGSLPVNLAAAVCKRGARYLHLSLEVPEAWRGRELTANDLLEIAARLDAYRIVRVESDFTHNDFKGGA